MSDLMVWLIIGGLIGGIARGVSTIIDTRSTRHSIAARAEKQHAQIMSGDEIGGTYGEYPPHVM